MRLVQIELVPDRLEIASELVALARLERRRTRVTQAREGDAVFALDASRTPAHDDDAVGHADGFADVVRDQDDGLVLVTQDRSDLVGERQARLIVERREWLVEQQEVRLAAERARQRHTLAHAAGQLARQRVDELRQALARPQIQRALPRRALVEL